jgi:hypothetical protein
VRARAGAGAVAAGLEAMAGHPGRDKGTGSEDHGHSCAVGRVRSLPGPSLGCGTVGD